MAQKDKAIEGLETHFKQLQEMAERMRTTVAPLLKQQEQFQKNMQPFIKAQQALQKALEPSLTAQKRLESIINSSVFPKITLPGLSPFTKQAEALAKSLEGLISPAFEQLDKSFRELPQRTQKAIILFGEHGWYFDLEIPYSILWKLKRALTEGNVTEAEDTLIEYFENRMDKIEKSIIERFPKRKKLLCAAFNAHRRQEYELSIPVLLAQADGMSKEMTNKYLFKKHNKKPQTAIYVEQFASEIIRAAILSPLTHTLPIGASEYERDEGFTELNRHMVLHEESVDYGNKVNGLKAISLINYVAHVFKRGNGNP